MSQGRQLTWPNSVTTSYSYDNLWRLLSVLHQAGGATIDRVTYMMDSAGNRSSRAPQRSGDASDRHCGELRADLETSQLPVMLKVKEVKVGMMMDSELEKGFEGVLAKLAKGATGLAILLAFLVVIPLTLWSAWAHRNPLVNQILLTLFCVSFAWMFVSMVLCYRRLRKLGLDGQGRLRLFSGARPDDPDELTAWLLGWHFMYAVIAVLLCIIAIPLASWLSGK